MTHVVNKVTRCLARYSPRTTTTNQPASRAPNEPAWPIRAKESIFLVKNGRFWAKRPNYFVREQKFWHTHIRKPVRHLVRIVFLVGLGTKWIRKANIWPKITQNAYFFGILISGNLLDTCFVLRILAGEAPMGRSERKSAKYTQKF